MNLQELIHYFKHLGPHDHIDIGQEEVNVILGALIFMDAHMQLMPEKYTYKPYIFNDAPWG